ncbi:MAG: carboxylesterase/lipase family protein [Congregibacter sp.]
MNSVALRWFVLTCGVLLVAAGLYLRWQEPAQGPLSLAASTETLRKTTQGPVIGGLSPEGAQAWLNIPYAAAPVGDYRWREPQRPKSWRVPRETISYGDVCPQFATALSAMGAEPGTLIGSEDCLSLNVFAPAGVNERSALPVMVFIHGGGNTIGSAVTYNASAFVQEQGVLVVTFNYRLGPFGWLRHAALRDDARSPAEASGNFALLDMVAALQWVQSNVGNFGGDPNRVTLWGESAGARNIYSLLATPYAAGLFHGAIIQSGFPGTFTRQRAESPHTDPIPGHRNSSHELLLGWLQQRDGDATRETALNTLDSLSDRDIVSFMRSLQTREIMQPLATGGGLYSIAALFRDGTVLPEKPLPEVFADPNAWNRVPLLVGSNRDEMKLFYALSDKHVSRRFGLFPTPRNSDEYNRLSAYHSDNWKAVGVDLPLRSIAAGSPDSALYAYRFDWDDMRQNWLMDLPDLLGAAHALELDFLFGPLIARAVPGVFHAGNKERREALARSMRDYWAGFAYSGKPGSGRSSSLSAWPRWGPDKPWVMLLDEEGDGGIRPEEVTVNVDDVKSRLRAQESDLSLRLRCALYVDLFLDNNGLSELFDTREYQSMGCGQFPAWSLAGLSR